jgi:glycosyltransferase involved in cell wall biosynthesis
LKPWTEAKSILSLRSLYEEFAPTLVHHATLKPIVYGTLAARLAGVPAVLNSFTGLGSVYANDTARNRLLRRAIESALVAGRRHPNAWSVFQNPDDRERMTDEGPLRKEHSHLIRGSGVDTDRYHPGGNGSDSTPVVVLASRMIEEKGVRDFKEAARKLAERGTEAKLVLVGEPPSEVPTAIPSNVLTRWESEGLLEWWGWRDDMPSVYAEADIVCLPTKYREGVPKVLLEAAACGKPLIGTDVPGSREIVRDGETGILVEPDDEDALARAIGRLAERPDYRREMGDMAREVACREFSEEVVVREHMAVYEKALQNAGPAPRGSD